MSGDADGEHSPMGEPGAPSGLEGREEGPGTRCCHFRGRRLDVGASGADTGDKGPRCLGFAAHALWGSTDSGESADGPSGSTVGRVNEVRGMGPR